MTSSSNGLRIAVVTQYFYPEEFRVNDLVRDLVNRGHEVHVLTGNPNYPSGTFAPGYGGLRLRRETLFGATIARVPILPRANGSGLRLLLNYVSFALSASIFGKWMLRGRFDAVFMYQLSPLTAAIPAIVLAKLSNAPVVLWVQDLWPQTLSAMGVANGRISKLLASRLCSAIYTRMRTVLIQSPAFRKPLEKQGVAPERISYVPNWAEDLYLPVDVPSSSSERAQTPVGFNILFAGNLGEAQGLETLLGAIEQTRDLSAVNWIILGDGRRAEWLHTELESTDALGRVHLLGRKPVESMPTWFALADVLVATLKSDPVFDSTIPSKLQSYLACAKPIIASMDGEGARVINESGAGFSTPAGDATALALAVRKMYEATPVERAIQSQRALAYYREHFSRREIINKIEDSVKQAAAGYQQGGRL